MANEEFYVGQIFEDSYPPAAAIACNQNGWYIDVIGERRYEIKEMPPAPAPTKEEQKEARAMAYASEIDPLHARKARKTILGEWTEEDEVEYVAKVKELSAEIVERYPYPTDPIFEEE